MVEFCTQDEIRVQLTRAGQDRYLQYYWERGRTNKRLRRDTSEPRESQWFIMRVYELMQIFGNSINSKGESRYIEGLYI